jgi:hypothetical protein
MPLPAMTRSFPLPDREDAPLVYDRPNSTRTLAASKKAAKASKNKKTREREFSKGQIAPLTELEIIYNDFSL